MLKERRPLVLLFRETPLHAGHIRIMQQANEAGAVVMPPVPAFYHLPETIDDIVDQTMGRALDQLDLESGVVRRWTGVRPPCEIGSAAPLSGLNDRVQLVRAGAAPR